MVRSDTEFCPVLLYALANCNLYSTIELFHQYHTGAIQTVPTSECLREGATCHENEYLRLRLQHNNGSIGYDEQRNHYYEGRMVEEGQGWKSTQGKHIENQEER